MSKNKVVLAYSGGLDTSVMIPWIKETYDCDVIALCANLGQAEELDGLEEKALKTGASKAYIEDLQDEFVEDFMLPCLQAGATYEGKYLLGTSFGRPLIAKRQVEIAKKEGANYVAHGATGKGNDQVRFELTYMALDPTLKVIAPWKDPKWELHSREACLEYAKQKGIPVTQSKKRIYSEDRNSFHISHEGAELEDPSQKASDSVYTLSNTLKAAPDEEETITLSFKAGKPTALNGQSLSLLALLEALNALGAKHAIGQIDLVENRLVGMKSRGVYETPGGSILFEAFRQLEQLVLDRDTKHTKEALALNYADLVYDGKWYCPLKDSLDAFFAQTMKPMTGEVSLSLYKGNIVYAGTSSPYSLYNDELASFSDTELYNQADANGFISLLGLPMKVQGMVNRKLDPNV